MSSHLDQGTNSVKAGFLTSRDRAAVLRYLRRDPRLNLQLLDLIDRPNRSVGDFRGGGVDPVVLVAWHLSEVVGVASLRPSLLFDARLEPLALHAFLPFLTTIPSGLLKTLAPVVSRLWELLESLGHRSMIDRYEIAFAIHPGEQTVPEPRPGVKLRGATEEDLPELVYAARASLREEGRPDPAERDPRGFERWVRGRIERARIVEYRGRMAFVAYADVRRPEGWLVQGVFTWPDLRRRGLAAAGMTGLVLEAFDQGADHLQLAVVEGNRPALELYRGLGFRAFGRLRTVLFVQPAGAHPV